MLTIKDLAAKKALDSKEMDSISGGTRAASPLLNFESIFAPSNQFGTQESVALAASGPQSNITGQFDNDVMHIGKGGQSFNEGGNYSTSNNSAHVTAVSTPYLIQV